jgi:hypothetical protein
MLHKPSSAAECKPEIVVQTVEKIVFQQQKTSQKKVTGKLLIKEYAPEGTLVREISKEPTVTTTDTQTERSEAANVATAVVTQPVSKDSYSVGLGYSMNCMYNKQLSIECVSLDASARVLDTPMSITIGINGQKKATLGLRVDF